MSDRAALCGVVRDDAGGLPRVTLSMKLSMNCGSTMRRGRHSARPPDVSALVVHW